MVHQSSEGADESRHSINREDQRDCSDDSSDNDVIVEEQKAEIVIRPEQEDEFVFREGQNPLEEEKSSPPLQMSWEEIEDDFLSSKLSANKQRTLSLNIRNIGSKIQEEFRGYRE